MDNYLGVQKDQSMNLPKIPLKINSLFPNPSFGKFELGLTNFSGGNVHIKVYNLLGQNIISKDIYSNSITLDLSYLSASIYVVRVTGNAGYKTFKLNVK